MARTRSKQTPPASKAPADPVLLDLDVADWAGKPMARSGRKDALLGRVEALRMSLDGASIEARVRGNRPLPYHVVVRVAEGRVTASCTCPGEEAGPCRHAVAAVEVLRFPRSGGTPAAGKRRGRGRAGRGRGRIIQHARAAPGLVILGESEWSRPREERIASARQEEMTQRRLRVRQERARVQALDGEGPPSYAVSAVKTGETAVVTLRGVDTDRPGCTCDDFAANELRTCKHIERVRGWRARQRKSQRRSVAAELASFWWWPRAWVEQSPDPLREIRIDLPLDASNALATRFDPSGWLRPAPEGVSRTDWAVEAREAFRALAQERGWRVDIDPTAEQVIADAECARDRRRLRAVDEKTWREVIDGLGFRLHPYQETGIRFIADTGRAFLADDMGLGKTVQAIVGGLLLRRLAAAPKALVVCPASLKHQWRREISKVCGEQAQVVEGSRPGRLAAYMRWREGFLILNYELVLRDLEAIRKAAPELIVLDEAQRIKNWNTKTARAVKQLESPYAFVLTGTPLENRLIELHSLVEFLDRRALGPRWRLVPFHTVTEPGGRVIAYEGLSVLRERLGPLFLRRERKQVMDQLPERTDNTFWTDMSAEQRRPYRQHAATAAALLSRKQTLGAAQVRALLKALTSMRILCNAWTQYAWDRAEELLRRSAAGAEVDIRSLHSPKLEEFTRVLEDLLEQQDRKVVVFSQWERMLRLSHLAARQVLDPRELRAEIFHGGLASRARSEMLESFHADPSFRVLFSTDAGGVGLNLQDAASVVVHLEVPWNPATLEQRIGRVHRIGQRRSVQVLHFVTSGAIEERVLQVVESKRALFEGLLVDEADQVVLDPRARDSFLERVRLLVGSD